LLKKLRGLKMPIYEYECESCGEVSEQMESINTTDTTKPCPKCNKTANRIMSSTSFHLKGGGWYTTDYKKGASCATKSDSPACSGCPAAKE
jgi:putative FmdB family regulatory protein